MTSTAMGLRTSADASSRAAQIATPSWPTRPSIRFAIRALGSTRCVAPKALRTADAIARLPMIARLPGSALAKVCFLEHCTDGA